MWYPQVWRALRMHFYMVSTWMGRSFYTFLLVCVLMGCTLCRFFVVSVCLGSLCMHLSIVSRCLGAILCVFLCGLHVWGGQCVSIFTWYPHIRGILCMHLCVVFDVWGALCIHFRMVFPPPHFAFIFTWHPHVWGAIRMLFYELFLCLGNILYAFVGIRMYGRQLHWFLRGIHISGWHLVCILCGIRISGWHFGCTFMWSAHSIPKHFWVQTCNPPCSIYIFISKVTIRPIAHASWHAMQQSASLYIHFSVQYTVGPEHVSFCVQYSNLPIAYVFSVQYSYPAILDLNQWIMLSERQSTTKLVSHWPRYSINKQTIWQFTSQAGNQPTSQLVNCVAS